MSPLKHFVLVQIKMKKRKWGRLPLSVKMDKTIYKCLDFCQTLAMSNQKSFSISLLVMTISTSATRNWWEVIGSMIILYQTWTKSLKKWLTLLGIIHVINVNLNLALRECWGNTLGESIKSHRWMDPVMLSW